ncbi:MAG: class I SAM-dependent methyltransferase [Thermoleophilia bacterium]|nr:class I SAM-dependent methyltransferase [Thermoleophilia bacterium]
MKVRDSGMPEEGLWEQLFEVELILDRLGVAGLTDLTELGCGYGTFTVPVARRITGTLHTYDMDETMVARTRERAADAGLANVVVERRDVLAQGFGLTPASQDGCLLFNILHHDDPVAILTAAGKILRPGGRLFVIHWRHDPRTPRGPDLSIRPRPEQVMAWADQAGFICARNETRDLPPWHYGLVFTNTGNAEGGS